MSGRAGVAIEAPEMDTSSTRQLRTMPSASCRDDRSLVRRQALVDALFDVAELVAIGKPGQLRGKLLALVLRGLDLEGEAAVERAHHQALDAADMIEIGDHALTDLER